ncbi:hypothetical protein FKW77_000696 [Venturia effusa]|uniref:Uncharacterized protein n=1 Tax=Venturia effusa TaxID=50376 RepID=A0A517LPG4_9PEZI|nr:hypothetical protein FKW77_000696 [Venturia effusa]
MVVVCLPFRGQHVSQSPEYNIGLPQQSHQREQQSQPQAKSWVRVLDTGILVVLCCEYESPYHKLICGHLIYTASRGCGRTCRAAVNSTKKLRTEFNCDRCADERTFTEMMKQIRQYWSAALLDNRIILLKDLQPYVDTFKHHLTLGRGAGNGRRGKKAFARTDEELVENFEIQIERLIERSCRYHLDLIMKKRENCIYDEPRDDDYYEENDSGEQLLDDSEEGEVLGNDELWDMGRGNDASVSDLTAALFLRQYAQSSAGVEHKWSIIDDLFRSVEFGDRFESVEETMEAEGGMMATLEVEACLMKSKKGSR